MQHISIAFIDVKSIKFAYGVGIEERFTSVLQRHIYVAKCKGK